MKVFATMLLVLLMQQVPQVPSPPNAPKKTSDPSSASQGNEPPKSKISSAGNGHISEEHGQTKKSDNDDDNFDTYLHRAYELATILGVVGGLIGLRYIWKQSKHTESAAKSAKESSDAALLNARAIINAERPWMFIEIKTVDDPAVIVGKVPEHLGFSVVFRNRGNTPAEIIGFDQHPDCCKDTLDLPSPPRYNLEGEVMVHTRMVPPRGTWSPPEDHFSPDVFLGTEWEEIRRSHKRFIYWGRLQYRDLVEESKTIHELKRDKPVTIHETCFCYFWSPRLNEFLIAGPFGYNKHT